MINWLGDKSNHGWGNGYVSLPKTHKHYGKSYNDLMSELPNLNVELTYGNQEDEYWVIGFDSAHYGMNQQNWNKQRVLNETIELERLLNE
jgi:hypothetical protein